ncbi:MAG: diaminopimelate epimerase, partial [Atribacterota bacterium]
MHFIKMQGLGNDFILINEKEAEKIVSYGPFARKMCDRHFGIGADGMIVVLPSDVAEVRMRIFNSDGSEAEMCGNGIRCLAKYVYEQAIVPDPIFTVETRAGIIVPEVLLEDEKVRAVRVDMGEPRLYPKEIPVRIQKERAIAEPLLLDDREFRFTAVSMGNPH